MIEWPEDVNKVMKRVFDCSADMVKIVRVILEEIDEESHCSVSLNEVTYIYGGGLRETIKRMKATVKDDSKDIVVPVVFDISESVMNNLGLATYTEQEKNRALRKTTQMDSIHLFAAIGKGKMCISRTPLAIKGEILKKFAS